MTPAGIEPATFQFLAQHLNHCATMVPSLHKCKPQIYILVNVPNTKHQWSTAFTHSLDILIDNSSSGLFRSCYAMNDCVGQRLLVP